MELRNAINNWVTDLLADYTPRKVYGNKIIKGAVWGMTVLNPLEISIVDCPLIQRLRRIHQTGLVFLTYPSAQHKRFDHSIGVMHCASLITSTINEKYLSMRERSPFHDREISEIRLAALLHDIGHACLSHLTEDIFSSHPWMVEEKEHLEKEKKIEPKNHELLSALIVRSPRFIKFLDECMSKNYSGDLDDAETTCKRISDMILGIPIDNDPQKAYISEVINGPFDADKLDYIFRDSYFTGMSLGTDIEKFIFGLSIATIDGRDLKKIVLDMNAVSSYDQLVLSKLALYSNVYNHQKVLATNTLITTILERMKNDPDISISGVSLKNPVDFLNLSDWEFLSGYTDDKDISNIQEMIKTRNLHVRLVRICRQSTNEKWLDVAIMKYFYSKGNELEELRKSLNQLIGVKSNGYNSIKFGLPVMPKLRETVDAYVRNFDGSIDEFDDISPMKQYSSYYNQKWVGYVYAPYSLVNRSNYDKICGILEKRFSVKFNKKAEPKGL